MSTLRYATAEVMVHEITTVIILDLVIDVGVSPELYESFLNVIIKLRKDQLPCVLRQWRLIQSLVRKIF